MNTTEIIKPLNMIPLFDELKVECLNSASLVEALKIPDLTKDQKEILLGKLSASVTHLHIHTGLLEKEIDEDFS